MSAGDFLLSPSSLFIYFILIDDACSELAVALIKLWRLLCQLKCLKLKKCQLQSETTVKILAVL